jgi:hypothetical protein
MDGMSTMGAKIELIQQWQTLGKVPAKLLEDEIFEICKKSGLTSLQSYVYWAEVEKHPGEVDFSSYDVLVKKLKANNLKWVPFLILGPSYATPEWFQKTDESVYAKCLEHGRETKIQSIWNPHLEKHVDRFLQLFSKHYLKSKVMESIELGISGNWGEAIYPDAGDFLYRRERFHTHPGWWCGDEYAISNFQESMKQKYGNVKKLNAAWNKSFMDFEEVEFPDVKKFNLFLWYIDSMKNMAKLMIKKKSGQATTWDSSTLSFNRSKYPPLHILKKSGERMQWLDFTWWYTSSMTDWAEFWIKTARKHFPSTEIYLVTGGDGNPLFGADFSAQARVASKHNAGIRITNQEAGYARNFSLCRLVSSACRHYGTYFTTEKGAWPDTPQSVVSRIFDAATSGARGIYFTDLVGIDTCIIGLPKCRTIGKPTKINLDSFAKNINYLTSENPIIEAAVLFPNNSILMDPSPLYSLYSVASHLRDVLDFDFVDENMIADDALRKYKFLIILSSASISSKTLAKIRDWLNGGGTLICGGHTNLSAVDGNEELYCSFQVHPGDTKKIGRGHIAVSKSKGSDYLDFVKQAVYNRDKKWQWKGISEIDDEFDAVYAARFSKKILYFNSTNASRIKQISIKNLPEKVEHELRLEPHSIKAVNLRI